ncbi:hypothetical protein K438DRAFT_1791260 [Mycena galopus ATCC 62051]|nr:hypothetical protein K438DRAFT_1791260 [Mycena galopus ATCC 62051]
MQDAVRRVWRERYGVTVAADFARHTPAAENLVQQCRSGSHGPAANEWALDFGYGYLTSLWNKAILDRFTDSVQGAHHESADGWGLPKVGRDYIFGLFQNQLKQAQEEWKKCQPRSSDTGDLETEQETACRLETTQQRRLRKKPRMRPRPDCALGVPNQLRSTFSTWTKRRGSCRSRGKRPPRVRDELHGDSAAPPVAGLPEKMYDEQWLDQKSDFYVEEKLRVSQEAFKLLVRLDKGKGRLEMDDDDDV